MFHKKRRFLSWNMFSRFLQIIQTLCIIVASFTIIQIPGQINEWRLSQLNRSTDLLLRLEDRLKESNNKKITSAIENNSPILIENKGTMTKQDLDLYLNDLMSISDIYSKELIDCDSVYMWFSDYFDEALKNGEVKKHIIEMQKIDVNSYRGLEEFSKEINNCQ